LFYVTLHHSSEVVQAQALRIFVRCFINANLIIIEKSTALVVPIDLASAFTIL